MQIFKIVWGQHAPGPSESLSCFSISFKLVLPKIKTLGKNAETVASFQNFLLRHWFHGVDYSSDYSKKHAFSSCDHSVIEQPCFHTYE